MLNEDSKKVYDILRSLTKEDEVFKIIDADEVLENLPQDMTLTKVQLSAIIKDLKENQYIVIKYFTPDEYCLQTLHKIEIVPEPVVVEQPTGHKKRVEQEAVIISENEVKVANSDAKPTKSVKSSKILFVAFLGAFLGGALVTALAIIIMKFI